MNQPEHDLRDPTRQSQILGEVRGRILAGLLAPGARLPRRLDLEQEFKVSRVTIQRVFDQLIEDGFVQANGRGGTCVTEHPPHRSRFALVFADSDLESNRFWMALSQEARLLSTPARTLIPYPDVYGAQSTPSQQRLLADLRARRLAGVIWVVHPGALADGPLVRGSPVPAVAIMTTSLPQLRGVAPDLRAFMARAVDHLADLGRRRIAVLSVPGHANERCVERMRERGLDVRPYWLQVLQPDQGAHARNLVHLLFNDQQRERPDALIIADDNLVEAGTGGLIAAGVRVPEDVELVAHCNFPWPTPSVVPAHRLGYDAREVLERCLDLLAAGPSGDIPGPPVLIAPVFERERLAQGR